VRSLVANTFVRSPSTQRLASNLVQSDKATSVKSLVGLSKLAAYNSLRSPRAERAGKRKGGAVQH
jgi:hypothetical protein